MACRRLRRDERGLGPRPHTLKSRQLESEVRHASLPLFDRVEFPALEDERPKTRGECGEQRPCPWVGCKYHLYLDVKDDHLLRYNFPDKQPEDLAHSCALDVADQGNHTLEEVGDRVNLSRSRVLLIEQRARAVLRSELRESGDDDDSGKGDW